MIKLEDYFDKSNLKYSHIMGTHRLMEHLATSLSLTGQLKQDCLDSALLHDIGYSEKVNKTGFHPYDGYVFCMENRLSPAVAKAVLLHSGAMSEMLFKNLGLESVYLPAIQSLTEQELFVLELTTFCDIHVTLNGCFVSLEDRIKDMSARYEPNSPVMKHVYADLPYFQCIDRKYKEHVKSYR